MQQASTVKHTGWGPFALAQRTEFEPRIVDGAVEAGSLVHETGFWRLHGRPDDGTDATGFFNAEFYVGLKPYNDSSWKGDVDTKEKLTAAIDKRLRAFPGIIFNYTQPAEDAVDEALTGLKSSLAVKIYGPDLEVLEKKAVEIGR